MATMGTEPSTAPAISSPKMAEVIEYGKDLYADAMEPHVLSWEKHPVWNSDPKLRLLPAEGVNGRMRGGPAPPGRGGCR